MPRQPSQFEPFIVSKVWTGGSYLTKRATFLSTLCPWPCPKIGRADDMCDCLILMCSLQDFPSQEPATGFKSIVPSAQQESHLAEGLASHPRAENH